MAKNLNSGYVGRYQSKRAERAMKNGELPLSKITRSKLERGGAQCSPRFVKWLCEEGYIKPTSKHHRGDPPVLVDFYTIESIKRQIDCLAIDLLFSEWQKGEK